MRRVALALLATAGVLMPFTASAQTRAPATSLRAEIEALNRGMEDAVKRGDLLAAAAFYADDAQVRMSRTVVAKGRKAIDNYFKSIAFPKDWKLELIDVGGPVDQPWEAGRSTLIYGKRPVTSVVDFLVVWKRQKDGRLKIILDYYQPVR